MTGKTALRIVLSALLAASALPGGPGNPSPAPAAGGHPMGGGHGHGSPAGEDTRVDLSADPATPRPGEEVVLAFRITDAATGEPAGDLSAAHDRILHVLIVRHDLEHFLHLHPEDTGPVSPETVASGVYRVSARFPAPGKYRVVADFARKGRNVVKEFDLAVEGESPPPAPPAVTPRDRTFEGYRVSLSAKHDPLHAEDPMTLWYQIRTGDGKRAPLEDYLGAKMHVVTWGSGTLRYVHAHPEGSGKRGQKVRLTFPVEGRYKIFGQFRAGGRVVTTEFVVDVAEHPPHKLPGL